MTYYYVDEVNGNNINTGLDMDNAWAQLTYALASGGLVSGDICWVRRNVTEVLAANVTPQNSGAIGSPIKYIGWPRNSISITSASWTNGSTTVDLIVGATLSFAAHAGRFITGPDGKDYLITRIVDTNTLIIDREYVGATVTGASGASTIKADEDYSLAQAIDDSSWTIKKTAWNGDADALPHLQGEAVGGYRLYNDTRNYIHYKNINLIGGTAPSITLDLRRSFGVIFRGCLMESKSNAICVRFNEENHIFFDRGIILGANAGTSERGVSLTQSFLKMYNAALYNFGDWGIYGADASYELDLENVNIGVEQPNGDDDMYLLHLPNVKAKNLKLGGTNGDVLINSFPGRVAVENYNKVLAAHRVFLAAGYLQKTLANGTGDSPNQRNQGSAYVQEIGFNIAGFANPIKEMAPLVFEHEFEAAAVSRVYRYYVQAMGAVQASELWLEAEYVDSYNDVTEYTMAKVESDESIAARATQSDWTNYLEVTGIHPAIVSKVRIKCFCSYYHATNKIFIDPKVSIT